MKYGNAYFPFWESNFHTFRNKSGLSHGGEGNISNLNVQQHSTLGAHHLAAVRFQSIFECYLESEWAGRACQSWALLVTWEAFGDTLLNTILNPSWGWVWYCGWEKPGGRSASTSPRVHLAGAGSLTFLRTLVVTPGFLQANRFPLAVAAGVALCEVLSLRCAWTNSCKSLLSAAAARVCEQIPRDLNCMQDASHAYLWVPTGVTEWGWLPESLETIRVLGPENPRRMFPSRILATFALRADSSLGKNDWDNWPIGYNGSCLLLPQIRGRSDTLEMYFFRSSWPSVQNSVPEANSAYSSWTLYKPGVPVNALPISCLCLLCNSFKSLTNFGRSFFSPFSHFLIDAFILSGSLLSNGSSPMPTSRRDSVRQWW